MQKLTSRVLHLSSLQSLLFKKQVNEFRKAEGRDEPMSEAEDEVEASTLTSATKHCTSTNEINNGSAIKQEPPERRHSTSTTSDTASACSPKDIQENDGRECKRKIDVTTGRRSIEALLLIAYCGTFSSAGSFLF